MTDKTKIFIDLTKCSEEQQEHIFSLLPPAQVEDDYRVKYEFKYLHFQTEINAWFVDEEYFYKTELTYPEFIKLFEGGETIKSDNTQALQNALQQIEKLEAEKKELVEALQYVYGKYEKDGHLLNVSPSKIESLIQKHKK